MCTLKIYKCKTIKNDNIKNNKAESDYVNSNIYKK